MRFRIQQIIDREQMTAAQFSDRVGIQRPTLSHVLNGRNNVSTEIISKIHNSYPTIATNWLMFGEGDMYIEPQSPLSLFLHDENAMDELADVSSARYDKDFELSQSKNAPKYIDNKVDNQKIEPVVIDSSKNRRVVKIMVFYSDNTFETFSSDIKR